MRMLSPEDVIEEFEALTGDVGEVQRETLRRILEQNGGTEYLRGFGLGGRTDPESFKACVPVVAHKDVEPYIQRIVDGDRSPILTAKPLTSISLSSGTTQGKSKRLPFNEELLENTVQMYRTSFAYINRKYPIACGKALQFIYASKQFKTKGGLTATTATTNIYLSNQYRNTMKEIHSEPCSPEEVVFGLNFDQSLYCHLLCGLIHSDQVQLVSSPFAHSIVQAFRTFEQVWQQLCTDIRLGVLSSRITVPSIRDAVSKILTPNPSLADSIQSKCLGLSNWYGVIPELWPNAKYVHSIMTGSMEPYVKKLQHYAGELPLLTAYYGASEGWIAANVNPERPLDSAAYAVLPNIGYFEFIPLRASCDEERLERTASTVQYEELEPVGLAEVEVGKEYEVVTTSFAGLYRCRIGDIVKVTGFYNSTPELQFVCRRNLLLSINLDKNTEKDLQLAVDEAAELLSPEKLEVVDFTSHADVSSDPGHYIIFWELSGGGGPCSDEVLQRCCNCMDRSFQDVGYVGSRNTGAIGPLELRLVEKGTFKRIMEHYLGFGATVSQFKTPRCVGSANAKVLQILGSSVCRSYFSTAYF